MTIYAEKPGHWYGWDAGKAQAYPCYEVPYADGSGMRPATLADARKLGLMKSVTAVTDILRKPNLETWKQEQMIHSALTLPREQEPAEAWWGRCVAELGQGAHNGEQVLFWAANNPRRYKLTDDEFAYCIAGDAKIQSEKAKERGTIIHEICEDMLADMSWTSLAPVAKPIRAWMDVTIKDVYLTEHVIGSPEYGVAGKLDCKANTFCAGMTYIDFKTQTIKNSNKPKFYSEWLYQLAGYRLLDEGPNSTSSLMSVVINTETGEVTHKLWSQEEANQGQLVFGMLNQIWNIQNKYWYGTSA